MRVMGTSEAEGAALSREAVIAAALDLLREGGEAALSMRSLADRLGIKAASLYWHFRDKDQLIEAVATALLDRGAVPSSRADWRGTVASACERLSHRLRRDPGAAPLILSTPAAVVQSRFTRDVAAVLVAAGLPGADEAARALVVQVVAAASLAPLAPRRPRSDQLMRLAIEGGSYRAVVRPGDAGMADVARAVGGGGGGPFVETRPDGTVLVRNWRGGNRGAVELNPDFTWFVKVHSGAWNATFDLTGVRLGGVDIDSGCGNVTCTLPAPRGIVPIRINSGIVGVTMHRPRGTAARALVHGGSLRVRFDSEAIRATRSDVRWHSSDVATAEDCYDVTVHSGCVKVSMDATAPRASAPAPLSEQRVDEELPASGVDLLLDGIERRLRP